MLRVYREQQRVVGVGVDVVKCTTYMMIQKDLFSENRELTVKSHDAQNNGQWFDDVQCQGCIGNSRG